MTVNHPKAMHNPPGCPCIGLRFSDPARHPRLNLSQTLEGTAQPGDGCWLGVGWPGQVLDVVVPNNDVAAGATYLVLLSV